METATITGRHPDQNTLTRRLDAIQHHLGMTAAQRRSLECLLGDGPAEAIARLDAYEAAGTPEQVLALVLEHLEDRHLPEYARAVDGEDGQTLEITTPIEPVPRSIDDDNPDWSMGTVVVPASRVLVAADPVTGPAGAMRVLDVLRALTHGLDRWSPDGQDVRVRRDVVGLGEHRTLPDGAHVWFFATDDLAAYVEHDGRHVPVRVGGTLGRWRVAALSSVGNTQDPFPALYLEDCEGHPAEGASE